MKYTLYEWGMFGTGEVHAGELRRIAADTGVELTLTTEELDDPGTWPDAIAAQLAPHGYSLTWDPQDQDVIVEIT